MDMDELRVQIGRKLRQHRRHIGMTIEQLSVASHVSVSHLSKIERGEINVTVGTLERVLKALKVTIDLDAITK